LIGEAEPAVLERRMDALRLTGVVGRRVLEVPSATPGVELAGHVSAWLEGHRARSQVYALTLRSVCDRLEDAGVPALPLKGQDLALRIHGDLGARPSADIDVLVAADQLPAAVEVLAAIGYRPSARADEPWLLELHHEVIHAGSGMPPVELHRRVEWYDGEAFAAAVLRRSARSPGALRRAAPADELAILLLIFARDGFAGLRLPADIAAWWDRYGGELAPRALEPIAEAHPSLARALATAAVVAERLVALPASDLLKIDSAGGRRSRLAARLADPLLQRGWPEATLVDGLLSDGPALRAWARRRVLPPRGHVAFTHGLRPTLTVRIAALQATQPLRVGARLAWAALGARRS